MTEGLSRQDGEVSCGGVTGRVVFLSLALALVFGYVIPIVDFKLSNTFLGATHLPPGSVAVLLVLLLVLNPLLRLVSARFAFSRNETLTVYITCLFSCLVPGHGAENFFVSNLIAPFYFATKENRWLDFLKPHLENWFTPAMKNGTYDDASRYVVEKWFTGLSPGDSIHWAAWLIPLVAWGTFIFVSYMMLGCLSVMLRAQWSEREALAFPLLRLPLAMTEDTGNAGRGVLPQTPALFRDALMWIGFGVAVFIQLLNGLNLYFPDVPPVPLTLNTIPLLSEPPWNQIGSTPIQILPIAVGITFLLTAEVSFSLWGFYWFLKAQFIAAYFLGFIPKSLPMALGTGGVPAFTTYQRIGAFFAYVALILWVGREHFGHIVRRAFGLARAKANEKDEPLSYPVAFWGFVLCFAFIIAWCVAAGIRWDVACALWGCYLVIAIALTRVVVEGGLLFVQHGWMPLGAMSQLIGSGPGAWLAPASIVPASFVQTAMMHDLRGFLLPSFVQSFKLARDRGIKARPLLALITAVILITLVLGIVMRVRLGYFNGGLSLNPWSAVAGPKWPPRLTQEIIKGANDMGWINWAWLGVGVLFTYGLMLARSRFLWFSLHPIGYLVGLTYSMNMLWFSVFLGWLCKVLITRFGGIEVYRRLTPMFLGLLLGDVFMMLFWLIIDGWQGRTMHQLMPG